MAAKKPHTSTAAGPRGTRSSCGARALRVAPDRMPSAATKASKPKTQAT